MKEFNFNFQASKNYKKKIGIFFKKPFERRNRRSKTLSLEKNVYAQ